MIHSRSGNGSSERCLISISKLRPANSTDCAVGWSSTFTGTAAKFNPKETVAMVAGGPINPEPYLRYLTQKVTSLYGAT